MWTFSFPFDHFCASAPGALSCQFLPFLCCFSIAPPECVAVTFLFLADISLSPASFLFHIMKTVFICCQGIILIQFCVFPS